MVEILPLQPTIFYRTNFPLSPPTYSTFIRPFTGPWSHVLLQYGLLFMIASKGRLIRITYLTHLLCVDGGCPLHHTAFALESGEVRGEWCPYPPVLGKVMGTVKRKEVLPVFDVRVKGKNIEVRLNSPVK